MHATCEDARARWQTLDSMGSMQSYLRSIAGFAVAPLVMAVFAVLISGLYTPIQWPGTFLSLLALAYPAAVVPGIPAIWFLRARKRDRLVHLFAAGAIVGIVPSTLLYAITVDPTLAFASLAGSALGGMAFWVVAVRNSETTLHAAAQENEI
jgi:hypothetical protein